MTQIPGTQSDNIQWTQRPKESAVEVWNFGVHALTSQASLYMKHWMSSFNTVTKKWMFMPKYPYKEVQETIILDMMAYIYNT